ncbi:MAG TPA: hypothetical protein VFE01_05590, partial [Terracidiphilus sp.]|nr:hypothetical protein [Terracidiphilus sp.]
MTIYAFPEAWIESRAQRLRQARRWLIVISVALLLVAFYLSLHSTGRPTEWYRLLFVSSFAVLGSLLRPFRKRSIYKESAEKWRIHSIEIDSEGLRINWATWSRFIPRNELTRIDEPPNGRGMYVR